MRESAASVRNGFVINWPPVAYLAASRALTCVHIVVSVTALGNLRHAASAFGGSSFCCLRNSATAHLSLSFKDSLKAGMPVSRMPCVIFQ